MKKLIINKMLLSIALLGIPGMSWAMATPLRFYFFYEPSKLDANKYVFLLKKAGKAPYFGPSYQLAGSEAIVSSAKLLKSDKDIETYVVAYQDRSYDTSIGEVGQEKRYYWVTDEQLRSALNMADKSGRNATIGVDGDTIALQDSFIQALRANSNFVDSFIGKMSEPSTKETGQQLAAKPMRFYLFYDSHENKYKFLLKQVGTSPYYGASYTLDKDEGLEKEAKLLRPDKKFQIYTLLKSYEIPVGQGNRYHWVHAERLSKALKDADESGAGATIKVQGITLPIHDILIKALRANPGFIDKYLTDEIPKTLTKIVKLTSQDAKDAYNLLHETGGLEIAALLTAVGNSQKELATKLVTKAVNKASLKWHPDKVQGDEKTKLAAKDQFQKIVNAKDLLLQAICHL